MLEDVIEVLRIGKRTIHPPLGARATQSFRMLPSSTVLITALLNLTCSGKCTINPPPGTFINEGDEIVLLRPTSFRPGDYQPLEQPVQLPPSACCVFVQLLAL